MNSGAYSESRKVLIVDDEPSICEVLGLALSRRGYSTFSAYTAGQALEMLKTEACPVMLIDLFLREGNGIDLYRRIRMEHPVSVAFLMTGYATEENIRHGRSVGFKSCFSKPVSLKDVYLSVHEAFVQLSEGAETPPGVEGIAV